MMAAGDAYGCPADLADTEIHERRLASNRDTSHDIG